MKRSISILLLLAMVCALSVPTVGAVELEELSLMEHTLSYAEIGDQAQPNLVTRNTRTTDSTSLIIAAPLMKEPACLYGGEVRIRSLLFSYGATNQYYCAAIYNNLNTLDQEPYVVFADLFPQEAGIYSVDFVWDGYKEIEGLYGFTVIFFTATMQDGALYPIEGTLSYQNAGPIMQNNPAALLNFYSYESIDDPDAADPITKLTMTVNEPTPAVAHVETWPCTSDGDLKLDYDSGYMTVTDLHGLLVFEPTTCGWTTIQASLDQASAELSIEICTQPDGHVEVEPVVVTEPTETQSGVTLHRCGICDATYEERTWLHLPVFMQFTDIGEYEWFCDAVQFTVDRGIFSGVSHTEFGPNDAMTRAMLVTVLWRYAGSTEEGTNSFTDVIDGTWYTEAVAWAAHNGVVAGIGNGKFDPDGNITREQMAAILYRYATKNGIDTGKRADLSSFPDASQVSKYAQEALQWAVAEGFISGTKEGNNIYLEPQGNATRAQVASILMRFIKAVENV